MAEERRAEEHREEVPREVHEDVSGSKGGAMEATFPARAYVQETDAERSLMLKDMIRWGPIWAGLVIALTAQLLLSALGIAVGIEGIIAAPGVISPAAASTLGVWMAVSALISLFLGGLAAARFAGVYGTMNGLWHGVVLWALALVIGSIGASLGATGLMGFLGQSFAIGAVPGMTPAEIQQVVQATAIGATWFIIGSLLGLAAAAIGGAVGARREEELSTETTTVR